jgi:hypothetical protein
MKLIYTLLCLMILPTITFSQTAFKEQKGGQAFTMSLPDYMSRTVGLNDAASLQFKSSVKDVYGFVIIDNKEELKLAEFLFANIVEFFDDFANNFVKDEPNRKMSKPESKKIGDYNFMSCDITYLDSEAKVEIYYFIGVVETPNSFYKVLCWSTAENKDKFKADFMKTFLSLKEL